MLITSIRSQEISLLWITLWFPLLFWDNCCHILIVGKRSLINKPLFLKPRACQIRMRLCPCAPMAIFHCSREYSHQLQCRSAAGLRWLFLIPENYKVIACRPRLANELNIVHLSKPLSTSWNRVFCWLATVSSPLRRDISRWQKSWNRGRSAVLISTSCSYVISVLIGISDYLNSLNSLAQFPASWMLHGKRKY